MNYSSSGRDSISNIRNLDNNAKEPCPTHTTNSDPLLVMPVDIFDQDASLSSSTTNESYSEDLYDWLQTQGTQTQTNKQNDYSHDTPPSLRTRSSSEGCCVNGDRPIDRHCALHSNSADNSPSHPLSPPPTIRSHKILPETSPASGLPHLEGSHDDFASTTGLGLLLPSHLAYDDVVGSVAGACVSNTNILGPPPAFGAKECQQLDFAHTTPQPNGVEDHADHPPPTVRRHFMHVIAELKLKSTERSAGTSALLIKVEPSAEQSQSESNDLKDKVLGVAEAVENHDEGAKKIGKILLEQSLLQEEQAQKLRILAETLCELALLRRTLSGMLCSNSKYEYEEAER
jgi:hypothetical protein